jgi:hypothetical protein
MENHEWASLEDALKKSVNKNDTFYYDYEANLILTIEGVGKEKHEYSKNQEETFSSIHSWMCQQKIRETYAVNAHRAVHLPPFCSPLLYPDDYKIMEQNKRVLRHGVNVNYDTVEFPIPEESDMRHTEVIFNMAKKAIDMFQEEPTALILFPEVWLPKIEAMYCFRFCSGTANSPSEFNTETLRQYFREINPCFNITVCTVAEKEKPYYKGDQKFSKERKIGVLFTYARLISSKDVSY